MRVAVLCDEASLDQYKVVFSKKHGRLDEVSVHAIAAKAGRPSLRDQLRKLVGSKQYDVFFNCLPNLYEKDELVGHVSAQEVSELLAAFGVPYTGVPSTKVHPAIEHIYMLAFYADFNVPKFVVIDTAKAPTAERFLANTQVAKLPRPFDIRCADGWDALLTVTASHGCEADSTKAQLNAWLNTYPRVIAQYTPPPTPDTDTKKTLRFVVMQLLQEQEEGGVRVGKAASIIDATVVEQLKQLDASFDATTFAERILKGFCGAQGYCSVEMVAERVKAPQGEKEDGTETVQYTVTNVVPNCDLRAYLDSDSALAAHVCELALSNWRFTQPLQIASFDHDAKGYFVRAARNIAKGEIVYHDEGNCLPVVTKGYVMKHWSPEDRVVFSRFAWPLDSDGHVYCIWQDDPKTWKPINHSCDPNLIHAKEHSLNCIAARDVAEGEELTLDYATFTDFTMKPFQCLCGASQCRGMIAPNAEALKKYGPNAWHRRAPPQERNAI